MTSSAHAGEPCLCFHCQLPVPDDADYGMEILGEQRQLCCPGCVAAANMIIDNNLTHYYEYRDVCDIGDIQVEPKKVEQSETREFEAWAKPDYKSRYCKEVDGQLEAEIIISGVRCAACVWLLEKYLAGVDGVENATVNLASHRCYVRFDESKVALETLFATIAQLGYQPYPYVASMEEALFQKQKKTMLKALGISAIAVMQVMMYTFALYAGAFEGIEPVYEKLLRWSSLVIITPVVLYSASLFYINAWRDLRNKKAGMDLPVSLAIIAAYLASLVNTAWLDGEVYFESVAMFVFFLLLSRFIELNARRQQATSTNELVSVFPDYALKINDGNEETVLLSELKSGDRVLVENGAVIPADGIIAKGSTMVDESAFSGESLPLNKATKAKVFAGSINVQNPFELEVQSVPENSLLSNMVRLTERAAADKPPLALLVDKVAGYFVMIVLLCALCAWVYWSQTDPSQSLAVVLAVLVVSCPCALSLATPVALSVGNKSLLMNGLMPTTGRLLGGLAEVDTVLFDKTGTLTDGKLDLVEVKVLSDIDEKQMLAIAASLEQGINHPLAKVLVTKAKALNLPDCETVKVTQGGGVSGTIEGVEYHLGNSEFVKASNIDDAMIKDNAINVFLYQGEQPLGIFVFNDSPRSDAKQAIRQLTKMGMDIHLVSGDGEKNCRYIAEQLGIEHHHANMKPEDKIAYLKNLADSGRKILMVGDGINDAAALKQAHVSIAIHDACEFVQAKTDGVMLGAKLTQTVKGIEFALRTKSIIAQNISWSLLYNFSALPMAAAGLIPPWVAALGMSTSSLIVLMNSWRISFYRGGSAA